MVQKQKRNGMLKLVKEELAECNKKHDAKTGSRRARRSAPARLVFYIYIAIPHYLIFLPSCASTSSLLIRARCFYGEQTRGVVSLITPSLSNIFSTWAGLSFFVCHKDQMRHSNGRGRSHLLAPRGRHLSNLIVSPSQ
jgi:hypothetical protein